MDREELAKLLNEHLSYCTAKTRDNMPGIIATDKGMAPVFMSDSIAVRGASGGNCWGGSAVGFDHGDLVDHLGIQSMDDFCQRELPGLTWVQHRQIMAEAKTIEWHVNEYYGNYATYAAKYVPHSVILDVLFP